VCCGRDRLEMFAAMLLSAGKRIVVQEPEELRQMFQELARLAERAAAGQPSPRRARSERIS
jgi:hypothetical protein